MLLKPKIYISVLFVYEIFAVMLLHCQHMCVPMLGETACSDWFRYFVACIVIPGLVSLIWMWVETIIGMYRYRFLRRARGAAMDMLDNVREKVADHMTRADIEHYMTVAALYGIRYYLAKNPKIKNLLHDMLPESKNWDLGDDENKKSKPKNKKKK